jgi:peptidoglycan-associated lipoprotein
MNMKNDFTSKLLLLILICSLGLFVSACAKKSATLDAKGAASNDKQAGIQAGQVNGSGYGSAQGDSDNKAAKDKISTILDHVFFEFDRYHLTPETRQIMEKVSAYLKDNPSVNILIEGHCDERGTAEYNYALGQRRADAAKRFLLDTGIDPRRLKTLSYGKDRPVDPASNEGAWAKNRRASFVVSQTQ